MSFSEISERSCHKMTSDLSSPSGSWRTSQNRLPSPVSLLLACGNVTQGGLTAWARLCTTCFTKRTSRQDSECWSVARWPSFSRLWKGCLRRVTGAGGVPRARLSLFFKSREVRWEQGCDLPVTFNFSSLGKHHQVLLSFHSMTFRIH